MSHSCKPTARSRKCRWIEDAQFENGYRSCFYCHTQTFEGAPPGLYSSVAQYEAMSSWKPRARSNMTM
jgi:hypothetical protein